MTNPALSFRSFWSIRSRGLPRLAGVMLLVLALPKENVAARTATWKLDPVDSDWNNSANWTPGRVPNARGDTAVFDSSSQTTVTSAFLVERGTIVFDETASSFSVAIINSEISLFRDGITNDSGVTQSFILGDGQAGGGIHFGNGSTAGDNTSFTNNPGPLFSAAFTGFGDNASAGTATIINLGTTTDSQDAGTTAFGANASAANASIISKGPTSTGAKAGAMSFSDQSTAANATLIADGGEIIFLEDSDGGTARIQLLGLGVLDITGHNLPSVTIGSLEGDGTAMLGNETLIIGSNNLSTTFAGLITDSGMGFGAAAKIGTGTLTLSGSNSFRAGMTVSEGILVVANTIGSATGLCPVQVNGGTLAGSGTIAGAVTIGSGSGAEAFLAPAAGARKQATLTIESALTFKSYATYSCTFKAKKNKARTDEVIANGVTIDNGATFDFSGTAQRKLRQGAVFTAISNTSGSPITGVFANLPDGAVLAVSGNNFQASYEGGDGNDLTLTVVP